MSTSLESAIRNCKVDTARANRDESDRFLNQKNMVCPLWNGRDSAGRSVCHDSFKSKSAGCQSANDRVEVENNVSRPQYMQYVTLSPTGIQGEFYDNKKKHNSRMSSKALNETHNITGYAGDDIRASIYPSCGGYNDSYNSTMS